MRGGKWHRLEATPFVWGFLFPRAPGTCAAAEGTFEAGSGLGVRQGPALPMAALGGRGFGDAIKTAGRDGKQEPQ